MTSCANVITPSLWSVEWHYGYTDHYRFLEKHQHLWY